MSTKPSMAAQRVGSLPEIVQLIIENTTFREIIGYDISKKGLFNYLTVNHMWFAETARVLWRQEIRLTDLWKLPFNRRQAYADFVVDLVINNEYVQGRQGRPMKERRWRKKNRDRILNFPRLESLNVFLFTDTVSDEVIAQYFVPTLRKVALLGNLTDGMLNTLAIRCRNLDILSIGLVLARRVSSAGVEMFARGCNARRLDILDSDPSVINILATKEKLEVVRFSSLTTTTFAELTQLSSHTNIFKTLTSFWCLENSVATEDILRIMPLLRNVAINVSGLDDAIACLARQPLLERVTLHASVGGLSPDILGALVGKHRMLKKLHLKSPDPATHDELNDAWIQDVTSFIPLLEYLEVDINNQITCEALIPIGHNCPLLNRIRIKVSREESVKSLADSEFSQNLGPEFRHLVHLEPSKWIRDVSEQQTEKHFPLIYQVTNSRRSPVMIAWRELNEI